MKHVDYTEVKPHYLKMILWRVLNCTVYPLLTNAKRQTLLRAFGAKIEGGLYYRSARIYAPWNFRAGHWAVIGPRVEVYNKARVVLGEGAVISQDSFLCTASHDIAAINLPLVTRPILIGANVWIGARTIILPGVMIGEGAVVGAGAVVAKNVEPWTVVVGSPAKFIKRRKLKND